MSFADRLRSGAFPVAVEITPAQRPNPRVLLRRAGLIGAYADAANVIQRVDRQSSLDASIELLARGVEPVWHLVTRGKSRAGVAAELEQARAGGIRNVLCIRGDHAGGDLPDTPTVRAVIALARDAIPGVLIGATLNQYSPDRDAALGNLLAKLDAGADYIQTQPAFAIEPLLASMEAVRIRFPNARLVAMAVPLLSPGAVDGIQRRLSFRLDARTCQRLAAGEEAGWELFDETLAVLRASALVDGVAIMTTEMDPPPGTGGRIVAALRAAGIGRSPA